MEGLAKMVSQIKMSIGLMSSIPRAQVKVDRNNFEKVGCKEDLVVKSMYFSTGGLELSSSTSDNSNFSSWDMGVYQKPLGYSQHLTHMHQHTETHN